MQRIFQLPRRIRRTEQIAAHGSAGGALVQKIQRFVRQILVRQIAARQLDCGIDGTVADGQMMMRFQHRAQTLENFPRFRL